jgi:cob(I)alamin adenosyltransferase
MPTYFTRNGDDGTTGLLGDERVPKNHLRPTTYGTLDEASAALGLARALSPSGETREIIMEVQRDLYKIMAEVAATPEEASRFRSIDADRITWLESERLIVQLEHEQGLDNPHLLPYLNRLSSLCFILALWENTQDGSTSISLANPKNP